MEIINSSPTEGSISQPDAESNSESAQKSIRATGASYMQAVNSGNMKEAQRMVDEAAKYALEGSKIVDDKGNLLKVYHGSDSDFTVFDRAKGRTNMDINGLFFSPWYEDA